MRGLLGSGHEPTLIEILSAPVFLVLFLVIIALVYQRGMKKRYESYGKMPLENDQPDSEGENR
jgi:cbb3-type cytochrome oxidase subunit 3